MQLLSILRSYVKKYGLPLVIVASCVALLGTWFVISKVLKPVAKHSCVYIMSDADNLKSRKDRPPVNVEIETVELSPISKRLTTVGHLSANASVVIKSETNNRIVKILFIEGADVDKNQELVEFENDDIKAEIKQAEGELELRASEFTRISSLRNKGIESQRKFDESKAGLKIAEAKLEGAKARLKKTIIKAPFEGTIGISNIKEGSYVQAGQELVTLVDSTPIKVEFRVPEKNVHDVGVGQHTEITVNAFKDKVFEGTVEAVDSTVEAKSHSLLLRASIPNDSGLLKPGMFADVSLVIGEKGGAVVLDEGAVEREGEIEFVWLIMNGKAFQKRILTGTREKGRIEVVAGLQPGDMVVTSGQLRLVNGIKVKISNVMTSESSVKKPEKEKTESKGV